MFAFLYDVFGRVLAGYCRNLFVLCSITAVAQQNTATILGTVVDPFRGFHRGRSGYRHGRINRAGTAGVELPDGSFTPAAASDRAVPVVAGTNGFQNLFARPALCCSSTRTPALRLHAGRKCFGAESKWRLRYRWWTPYRPLVET